MYIEAATLQTCELLFREKFKKPMPQIIIYLSIHLPLLYFFIKKIKVLW